jgi:L-threonylcarbamoyladenylate synthase
MTQALPLTALAEQLMAGEAAIFPTDTLPALACRPQWASQLWQLKRRPQEKPLILMGACADDLWSCLGEPARSEWRELADRHWPGALTLVLPAKGAIAEALNPGGGSLGLRVPNCAVARALLQRTGPLATTSANRSGQPACLTAEEAGARMPEVARLAADAWPEPSGLASTVVRWEENMRWRLLRRGAVLPLGIVAGQD